MAGLRRRTSCRWPRCEDVRFRNFHLRAQLRTAARRNLSFSIESSATHRAVEAILPARRADDISHPGGDTAIDESYAGQGRRGVGDQAAVRAAYREPGNVEVMTLARHVRA